MSAAAAVSHVPTTSGHVALTFQCDTIYPQSFVPTPLLYLVIVCFSGVVKRAAKGEFAGGFCDNLVTKMLFICGTLVIKLTKYFYFLNCEFYELVQPIKVKTGI